jgi:hypothetical protein
MASLYQMWVSPTHRGFGAGSRARRLYQRAGFAPVAEPQPLRPGFHLLSQPMELELSHDAA